MQLSVERYLEVTYKHLAKDTASQTLEKEPSLVKESPSTVEVYSVINTFSKEDESSIL